MRIVSPLFLLLFVVGVLSVSAQETVTIPKSRLQELEKKEMELRALDGEMEFSHHIKSVVTR